MPRVPVYGDSQVRTEALRPVFQNTPDVSSGARALGQGLQNLGEGIDRIALQQDRTQADQVDAQITTEWMKWDAENRNKYRGQNADAYEPAAQEWWKKAAEEFGKDLSPRAKALASRSLVRKQGTALANVVQFVGVEKERFADESASAAISSTIQFGVTTGDVAGASQQVREQVAAVGARKGWTTEQVQAEQLKNLSALHLAQITKLTETDAQAAQKYYDDNKGEVNFQNQAKIEQVLKAEVDNQFATQFAAQNAALPLDEQLKAAGGITDPKRREKALMQIKTNHALVKEAQRAQEEQFADQAWQLVGQGRRVPEAVLAGMDGRQRVQLQEHLRARAERGPIQPKTDPREHARLIDMMLNDKEAFKTVRLAASSMKLSPADLEQFAAKQEAIRAGGGKQDSMLTDEARVNAALIGAGIDAKKQPEIATTVRTEIDKRVRAASAEKGDKPLTPDEKQRVVDSVMLDKVFVDDGWFSDTQKQLALVKPDELKDAYVTVAGKPVKLSSVPTTDRAQIISALKKRGLPVTEQAIAEIYLRKNPK